MNISDFTPQSLLMKCIAWMSLIGVVLFALWTTANHFENIGYEKARAQYTAQALKDTESARVKEQQLQTKVNEAQNARSRAEDVLRNSIINSRNTVNQLREQLNTANRNLSNYSSAALIARVNTVSDLFEQCTSAYADLAAKADGHAADVKLMQDSWPK